MAEPGCTDGALRATGPGDTNEATRMAAPGGTDGATRTVELGEADGVMRAVELGGAMQMAGLGAACGDSTLFIGLDEARGAPTRFAGSGGAGESSVG
jgi:hypothetical protein